MGRRTIEATTYEIGASAGLAVEAPPFTGLFVQAEVNRRRFDGLRWDGSPLPPGWPRAIDASAWSLSVGWQFRLTGPEPGPETGEADAD